VGKISTSDSQNEQRLFQWQSLPIVLGVLAKLRKATVICVMCDRQSARKYAASTAMIFVTLDI